MAARLFRGRKCDQLRRDDVVELRSPAEILETLDEDGCLDGVPFMPEMLRFFGGQFTVVARVERACDTVNPINSRRMPNTVLLDGLRCDGSAHGGCEAGCLLYWKEPWLRRVSGVDTHPADVPNGSLEQLEDRVQGNTRAAPTANGGQKEIFRCQATEFPEATEPLSWFDAGSFVRELTGGNVGIWPWLKVSIRAFLYALGLKLRLHMPGPVHPRLGDVTRTPELSLKAGDLVRVKSKAEIERTLDSAFKTRGLGYDREMLPYCGQTHTVKRQVTRFIDEATGEMVELKSDAVILDGVVCRGQHSIGRWFCPRAIYPWWRDCWLERVEDEPTTPS